MRPLPSRAGWPSPTGVQGGLLERLPRAVDLRLRLRLWCACGCGWLVGSGGGFCSSHANTPVHLRIGRAREPDPCRETSAQVRKLLGECVEGGLPCGHCVHPCRGGGRSPATHGWHALLLLLLTRMGNNQLLLIAVTWGAQCTACSCVWMTVRAYRHGWLAGGGRGRAWWSCWWEWKGEGGAEREGESVLAWIDGKWMLSPVSV